MKHRIWMAAGLLLLHAPVRAQVEALEYRADRVPVGQVLHYVKTQLDGSHAARISIYVASKERVEALKWQWGGDEATLVAADMDWQRFSVRAFEASHLARGAAPEVRATLSVEGDQLRMSLMPEPLTLRHFPWHSYDFDFTSLALTLPHRRDPRAAFRFWRTDFVYGDAPVIAELGEMQLRFVKRERRHGVRTWKYALGGPGLEGREGSWWLDPRTGRTLEYELPVGDEPGYADVRLRLESQATMSAEEWRAFKDASVGS